MKRILSFIIVILESLTVFSATEEVTETWTMNGSACSISGSTLSNGAGNRMDLNNNMTWTQFSTYSSIDTSQKGLVTNSYNTEISFPDIEGTVTKVELKNFFLGDVGLVLYAGTSMSSLFNKSTGGTAYPSWDDFSYSGDVTYTGTMDVTSSSPLKLMFRAASSTIPDLQIFEFSKGYIKVTYEKEVAADPQHTFSFPNPSSFSGNTLTVTCTNNGAGHECTLTNRQATLTLTAHDNTIESFSLDNPSLNLLDFNTLTGLGATAGSITYTNKTTGNSTTGMIFETGEYTASVTVTVGGNNYTLTKDFSILAGYRVNNKYSQFSVSKVSALEGEAMSITYTQLMDEILEGLTLTGATSGNNIAYTQSGNTYTITMPAEDVNLSATITYPLNEDNITLSGDTYTIKTAEGWNYFCRRMEVDDDLNGFSGKTIKLADNISVTTMAGSGKYPFKGTFDGDGHTLTFNYTATAFYSAPFQKTNGTTIRNLHTMGSIQTGDFQNCGGLVGSAEGNLTIENCRVSIQISTTYSGSAWHGGFVGLLSSHYDQCHITGCVFDGLIYNSNTWNQTYGCGGFVGAMSEYGYAILKDCLFIHGQYDNNNGKCELWWGNENNKNSTFVGYDMSNGGAKFTYCFYVGTRGLKQGSPAVESATAPTNFAHFGDPTTDYGFLKVYGHTMVFNNKYYTPTYGDLVEEYDYGGGKSYNIEYDDAPLGIPDITTQLWVRLLRYKRKFTAGKPVTVMLPFNFVPNDFRRGGEGDVLTGHFYEFKGIHLDSQTSKWTAEMNEVGSDDANEVTTMKANHPYLFVPTMSTVPHPYMNNLEYIYIDNGGSGISIFTQDNGEGNKVVEYDGTADFAWNKWDFIGTYQPRYWYDGSDSEHPAENIGELDKVYGFAGSTKEVQGVYNNTTTVEAGEFVRAKSGAKIRPTSCYLMWTGYEPDYAPARRMTRGAAADEDVPQRITVKLISASGEVTSIGEIDTKTGEVTFGSEAWYTLDGVRLSGKPSTKGIYINKGKKVVIK